MTSNKYKNNTQAKRQTIFIVDGTITSPKVVEQCMQEHLYAHFEIEPPSGFPDDVSLMLIDKTDVSNPTKRKIYCMETLKTIATNGLKVENSV